MNLPEFSLLTQSGPFWGLAKNLLCFGWPDEANMQQRTTHTGFDRVADDLMLAQDFLASMLGVRRPSVSVSGHLTQQRRSVSGGLFFNKPYRAEQVLDACRRLCLG